MPDTIADAEHPLWGRVSAYYRTDIGHGADHPRAHNVMDHEPGQPTFYEMPSTYPVTLVPARYGGSYEGAQWLAFPCYPHEVHVKCPAYDDSDVECAAFWDEVRADPLTWLIGRGQTLEDAYYNLIDMMAALPQLGA